MDNYIFFIRILQVFLKYKFDKKRKIYYNIMGMIDYNYTKYSYLHFLIKRCKNV